MQKLAILCVFCLLAFVFACTTTTHEVKIQEAGARLMTQADLEALFSKELNTSYVTPRSKGTSKYLPNGTLTIDWGSGDDTGTYRLVNGQYCSKLDTIRKNERCVKVYQVGEKEFHFVGPSGELSSKVFIE